MGRCEEKQEHRTARFVTRLAFSSDGSHLDTNIGQLSVETVLATDRALVTKPQSDLPSFGCHTNIGVVVIMRMYRFL